MGEAEGTSVTQGASMEPRNHLDVKLRTQPLAQHSFRRGPSVLISEDRSNVGWELGGPKPWSQACVSGEQPELGLNVGSGLSCKPDPLAQAGAGR